MGALFDVVHGTIMSSDGQKEAFDKSWAISDVGHENAPRFKNFDKVRTNAIGLLKAHAKEILNARSLAPKVLIEPSPQTPSVAHHKMTVDSTSGPVDSDVDMKTEDPSAFESPPGELQLMYSRVAVFNERFRDYHMGSRTVQHPRHQTRRDSGRRPVQTKFVVLHVHI
jgi:hypothetical protein